MLVYDLQEDEVLADPERVVAAPVERLRRDPPEVANARQRDVDEPVEELVHARPTQRHARADRHSLAELVRCDRLLRLRHDGPLAGDRGELLRGAFQDLGVRQDRKSTRLNSSHLVISYAVFCLKKKIETS